MESIVMTFGTFDYIHPGHKFYLRQAKKQGDILVTIIARDTNVLRVKGSSPLYTEDRRLEQVWKTNIPNIVELGDEEDIYKVLSIYMPTVICLGYDQIADEGAILSYCAKFGHIPTIMRIDAYKPELHKSSKKKERRYNTSRYI